MINLTVNNVNRPPVFAVFGYKTVDENISMNLIVHAIDFDGDSITYSTANLPSGATFVGQTFNWTPDYEQAGTYQVNFTVSDGQAQVSRMINLIVNDTINDRVAILLNENFDDGTYDGWSIIDEGTRAGP